jgi:hypothetical protein
VKGSFLRRNGSFGGRSKITQPSPAVTFRRNHRAFLYDGSDEQKITNGDERLERACLVWLINRVWGTLLQKVTATELYWHMSMKIMTLCCLNQWTVSSGGLGHYGAMLELQVAVAASVLGFSWKDYPFLREMR